MQFTLQEISYKLYIFEINQNKWSPIWILLNKLSDK